MYILPKTLESEIDAFSQQITDFKNGNVEPVKFKAIRVPMGIYEQRTDGTYMVRIRCAAGMITPSQLLKVSRLVQEYGTEPIHLTTRQELQLHNAKLEELPAILKHLYHLGLSARGGGGNTVRNIMASEDAGISPDEQFDVTPYAVALTSTLIAEPDSWSLPRKYKIAFSGNDTDNANAIFNDLGFIATRKNGEKGFKVFLGGGMGLQPAAGHLLFDFLPASNILYMGEAVKQLFSEHGNRRNRHKARLRYVFYKLGKEKVFELFHHYFTRLIKENNYTLNLPEISSPSNRGSKTDQIPGDKSYNIWLKRYVKTQRQAGLYSVEIPLKHGITDAELLSSLARILIPFGNDCLRLTMRQNILLRNIPGYNLPELYRELNSLGVDTGKPRLLNNLVACAGADTCRLGLCLARGASSAIESELEKLDETILNQLASLRINLSGCPNSCGQHGLSHLGFYGKVSRNDRLYPAYYITVGGLTGVGRAQLGERIGEISARDLPLFTAGVLKIFAQSGMGTDSFSAFLANGGKEKISNLLKKFQMIPNFEEDKNYYFDWGAEELFSLKGKGAGECSAGMFDMIDLDRDAILELQKNLESNTSDENADGLLYKIVFHSSRMLLVTRGIEPKSREEVFTAFKNSFLNEGYIDSRFTPLLKRALENPDSTFFEHRTEVLELASSVIELYNNMDDSLQFKIEERKEPAGNNKVEKHAIHVKDLRGVACPMNFVKTKIELAQMKAGEILEILLDDGAPIQNVPGSVQSEGHKVIKEKKIDDYWVVVIEKK